MKPNPFKESKADKAVDKASMKKPGGSKKMPPAMMAKMGKMASMDKTAKVKKLY